MEKKEKETKVYRLVGISNTATTLAEMLNEELENRNRNRSKITETIKNIVELLLPSLSSEKSDCFHKQIYHNFDAPILISSPINLIEDNIFISYSIKNGCKEPKRKQPFITIKNDNQENIINQLNKAGLPIETIRENNIISIFFLIE